MTACNGYIRSGAAYPVVTISLDYSLPALTFCGGGGGTGDEYWLIKPTLACQCPQPTSVRIGIARCLLSEPKLSSESCRHVKGTAGHLQQAAGVAHDNKDGCCEAAGAPQPPRVVLVQSTGGDVCRSVRCWDFVQSWSCGLDHLQAACKSIHSSTIHSSTLNG